MFRPVDPKLSSEIEHKHIEYWKRRILKSVEQERKTQVRFRWSSFANGLPHYGHILAQSLKDAVTRYSLCGLLCPSCEQLGLSWASVEYEVKKPWLKRTETSKPWALKLLMVNVAKVFSLYRAVE